MALNFPSSPLVGTVYTDQGASWKWDGTAWVSFSADSGGGAPAVYVGPTPPPSPVVGQLWYRTVAPTGEFIWMDDGNSKQWVQTNGGVASLPFATTAEARAGVRADALMSPALVQALQGVIFPTQTTTTRVFDGIPAEATELLIIINGLQYAANQLVSLTFNGATVAQSFYTSRSVAINAAAAQVVLGDDNAAYMIVDTNTTATGLAGCIRLSRVNMSQWTVEGTIRRAPNVLITHGGICNFTGTLSSMTMASVGALTGGATMRWII